MCEHLDLHLVSRRAADVVAVDHGLYCLYLVKIELARKHYHICELSIESERLCIRDAELSRNMDLNANLACICYGSHIRCDDSCDSCCLCCVEGFAHILKVVVEECDVEGEVGLYSNFRAYPYDLFEVGHLEVVCRV